MTKDENKLQILKKVESGTLSVEEGADLLDILDRTNGSEPISATLQGEVVDNTPNLPLPENVPAGWKALWSVFIYVGILFMGASGYWLYSSYTRSGLGVGFWFATFFLLLSAAIVFLGWHLVNEHWMVLRIRTKENEKTQSFLLWAPIPIHFALWAIRTFGRYMPGEVQEMNIAGILREMEGSLKENEFFQIDLDGDRQHNVAFHAEF